MFGTHWKQNTSIISARLLRENLSYSRLLGFLFFRFGNDKDGLVILDDNRIWWKWFILLHRMICLVGLYFGFAVLFDGFNSVLHDACTCARFGLILIQNFWIIRQQFFMNTQAISLANTVLQLFRRLRCLRTQDEFGFGGKRELVLIILIICCRIYDITAVSTFIVKSFDLRIILTYWGTVYTFTYINLSVHFSYLWYLALGVLHSELNELMENDLNNSRNLNFELYLNIYRKVRESSIEFKKMFNYHTYFHVVSTVIYIGEMSNLMIKNLSFAHPLLWTCFLKAIIEYKLFCSVVERIIKECDKTRLIVFEASTIQNTKESNQAVEMFITYLNLNPFSLQLFGLFEVSNSSYLRMVSDGVNYVIIVVQFIMQKNQM